MTRVGQKFQTDHNKIEIFTSRENLLNFWQTHRNGANVGHLIFHLSGCKEDRAVAIRLWKEQFKRRANVQISTNEKLNVRFWLKKKISTLAMHQKTKCPVIFVR